MKKLLVKLKKTLAGMLAAAIAVTGIPMLPATEGLEKVSKDLGVVKEAKAAEWGAAIPDSSIEIGDTINWNGKTFKAVKKDGNGMLMLSQSSFGARCWYEVLDTCSEHGDRSITSDWFNGLNEEQKTAMKVMPEIKCDQYGGNYSAYRASITNTKLFPLSYEEANSIGENRKIGVEYLTRTLHHYWEHYSNYNCDKCGKYYEDWPGQCTNCGSIINGDWGFNAWCVDRNGALNDNNLKHFGDIVPAFYLITPCDHTNTTSTILTPATCTEKGTTQYTCDDCDKTWTAQDIPALGHDSDNRTCNGDGTDTLSCSKCGATQNTVPCTHYKTLTYDATTNGGTGNASSECLINSAVDLTKRAEKSSWDFVGWNTDKDATTALTSYSMPTENSTLYAIFKRSLDLLCADSDGDNPWNTTIFNRTTSATMQLPAIGGKDGWTAVGWTTSTDPNSQETLAAGTSITVS